MAEPGRVLGVGIATVDIVNQVDRYPAEDAEVRALASRVARGGNCANTLAVLAALGHACAFAGTVADDAGGAFIRAELAARGIDLGGATLVPGAATPTSYITLSAATGSRTIVHHRQLPELSNAAFAGVALGGLGWVHFEGRNCAETAAMIARVTREAPALPISVEIEKPRLGIEGLYRFPAPARGPRVLLLARAYAEATGARSPATFLAAIAADSNADLLIAPWGADGAYARADGILLHAPAAPPTVLRDTLGAGDVFNAAIIDGLLAGLDAPTLLARANSLAGHACGIDGLDDVVTEAHAAGWC